MAALSKRMVSLTEKVTDKDPVSVTEAVELLKSFGALKFDQSVEIAMRLGVDPKQGYGLSLHIGTHHSSVRIIVFEKGDEPSGNANHLARSHVDVFNLFRRYKFKITQMASYKIGCSEFAVTGRRIRRRNIGLRFFVRS